MENNQQWSWVYAVLAGVGEVLFEMAITPEDQPGEITIRKLCLVGKGPNPNQLQVIAHPLIKAGMIGKRQTVLRQNLLITSAPSDDLIEAAKNEHSPLLKPSKPRLFRGRNGDKG